LRLFSRPAFRRRHGAQQLREIDLSNLTLSIGPPNAVVRGWTRARVSFRGYAEIWGGAAVAPAASCVMGCPRVKVGAREFPQGSSAAKDEKLSWRCQIIVVRAVGNLRTHRLCILQLIVGPSKMTA
jgi:hypothetical protein